MKKQREEIKLAEEKELEILSAKFESQIKEKENQLSLKLKRLSEDNQSQLEHEKERLQLELEAKRAALKKDQLDKTLKLETVSCCDQSRLAFG